MNKKRELKKSTNLLNDWWDLCQLLWGCGPLNNLQPAFAFTCGCSYSSSRSHLCSKTLTRWPISMHLASQNFPTFDCGCSHWSPCTVVVYLDLSLSLGLKLLHSKQLPSFHLGYLHRRTTCWSFWDCELHLDKLLNIFRNSRAVQQPVHCIEEVWSKLPRTSVILYGATLSTS